MTWVSSGSGNTTSLSDRRLLNLSRLKFFYGLKKFYYRFYSHRILFILINIVDWLLLLKYLWTNFLWRYGGWSITICVSLQHIKVFFLFEVFISLISILNHFIDVLFWFLLLRVGCDGWDCISLREGCDEYILPVVVRITQHLAHDRPISRTNILERDCLSNQTHKTVHYESFACEFLIWICHSLILKQLKNCLRYQNRP